MFYERFLALCNARNIKPTAVADAIGVSRMNASRWKKGTMPSFANLQKLAEYFEVPLDYLTGTHEMLTVDVRNPEEVQEKISEAEIEKDKIILEKLLKEIDTIPKRYKAEAIHEMAAFMQFTLHKYKTLVPEESFIGL